ncbi:MAG: SpoIIE family protein phosphatase [bacterium]|nr:MAG: SpoIIE family protein phosphatase [bacterium]
MKPIHTRIVAFVLISIFCCLVPATVSATNTIRNNYERTLQAYETKQWRLADKLATLTLQQIDARSKMDWRYSGERRPIMTYFSGDLVYMGTSDRDQGWKLSKVEIYDPQNDRLVLVRDYTPWNVAHSTHTTNYTITYIDKTGFLGYKILWFEKGKPETEHSILREGIERFHAERKIDGDFVELWEKGPRGWGLSIFDIAAGDVKEVHIFETVDFKEWIGYQAKLCKDEEYWKFFDGKKLYSLKVGSWEKELIYTLPFNVSVNDFFCSKYFEKFIAVRNDTLNILRQGERNSYALETFKLPFPLHINHWIKMTDCDESGTWFAQSDSDSLRIFRLNDGTARPVHSTASCLGNTSILSPDFTSTFWKGDTLIHFGNTGMKVFKGADLLHQIESENILISYNHEIELFMTYLAPGEYTALDINTLEHRWKRRYTTSHFEIFDLYKDKYLAFNHIDGTSLIDIWNGEEVLRIAEMPNLARAVSDDTTKILLGGDNFLHVYEIPNPRQLKGSLLAVTACSKWEQQDTTAALKYIRESLALGSNLTVGLPECMFKILSSLQLEKETLRLVGNMAIRSESDQWAGKLKDAGAELFLQPRLSEFFAIFVVDKGVMAFPAIFYPFSIAKAEPRKWIWFEKPDYQTEELMLNISGISFTMESVFFFEYQKNETNDKLIWSPLLFTDSGEMQNLGPILETPVEETDPDKQLYIGYSVMWQAYYNNLGNRALTNLALREGGVGGSGGGLKYEFTAGFDLSEKGNNWIDSTTVNPIRIGNRFYAHKRYGDLITHVAEGSQADSIGVKDGDIALRLGDHSITNTMNINRIKTHYPDRYPLDFVVLRDGDTLRFHVLNGIIGYDPGVALNLVEVDPESGEHLKEIPLPPGYGPQGLNSSGELIYTHNDSLLFFEPLSQSKKIVVIKGIKDYTRFKSVPAKDILLLIKPGVEEVIAVDISRTAGDMDRVLWRDTYEDVFRMYKEARYLINTAEEELPILLQDGTLLIIDTASGSVLSRESLPFQSFGLLPQLWDGVIYGVTAGSIFGWSVDYYNPPFPWRTMGIGAAAIVPLLFVSLLLNRVRIERLKRKQVQELKHAEIDAEISAARKLQAGLIPTGSHKLGAFYLVGKFIPASEVAGDYFDFRLLDDGRLVVVMGDVSGHGLSAGILVSMAKASLMTFHRSKGTDFTGTLESLNEVIRNGSPRKDMFMTLCYAVFDPKRRVVACSSNGHPFPLIARRDGSVSEIGSTGGYPLGVREEQEFHIAEVDFKPGDTILIYTDGLPEQMNEADEPWGYDNFIEVFQRLTQFSRLENLVNGVLERALTYTGKAKRADDMALVAIRYKE